MMILMPNSAKLSCKRALQEDGPHRVELGRALTLALTSSASCIVQSLGSQHNVLDPFQCELLSGEGISESFARPLFLCA